MFMPNPQQGGYQVPTSVPAPAPAAPPPAQTGMVAHESNGMVYYYDPGQIAYAAAPPPMEGYPPPGNYTVPGMGGMMTPSPDGYYYPQVPPGGMVYYTPQ